MNAITDLIIPHDILELEDISITQKALLAFMRQYPNTPIKTIGEIFGMSKRQILYHKKKLQVVLKTSPLEDGVVLKIAPSNKEVLKIAPLDNDEVLKIAPSDKEVLKTSPPDNDEVLKTSPPDNDEVLKIAPHDDINPYEWSWNFINDIKTVEEYRSKEKKIDKILSKKGVFTYDELMTLIWMVDGKEKELKLK
jgi:hypothetical protein